MRDTCMCQSFDVLGGHRVSGKLPEDVRLRDCLCGVILANTESSTTKVIS